MCARQRPLRTPRPRASRAIKKTLALPLHRVDACGLLVCCSGSSRIVVRHGQRALERSSRCGSTLFTAPRCVACRLPVAAIVEGVRNVLSMGGSMRSKSGGDCSCTRSRTVSLANSASQRSAITAATASFCARGIEPMPTGDSHPRGHADVRDGALMFPADSMRSSHWHHIPRPRTRPAQHVATMSFCAWTTLYSKRAYRVPRLGGTAITAVRDGRRRPSPRRPCPTNSNVQSTRRGRNGRCAR